MELMDRYIYDIGRRLPAKQREDIEKELASLLADALDARVEGREPTETESSRSSPILGLPRRLLPDTMENATSSAHACSTSII